MVVERLMKEPSVDINLIVNVRDPPQPLNFLIVYPNFKYSSPQNRTALMQAAYNGHTKTAQVLLSHSSLQVNMQTEVGCFFCGGYWPLCLVSQSHCNFSICSHG